MLEVDSIDAMLDFLWNSLVCAILKEDNLASDIFWLKNNADDLFGDICKMSAKLSCALIRLRYVIPRSRSFNSLDMRPTASEHVDHVSTIFLSSALSTRSAGKHQWFLVTVCTFIKVYFVFLLLHAGDSQIECFLAIGEEGVLNNLASTVQLLASGELFAYVSMVLPS